ncbi:MAG: DNA mismatch repair endonuclease MutH [Deltaproteobacteria bacterium]|nr:DNA mismatch repair endonuclease MutH [Deltaproteobacteria bacterium]
MSPIAPPRDESDLRQRLSRLAGRTLAHLAAAQDVTLPTDLRRAKGLVGQLLERALGATAASRAVPDFPELDIELKTLPIDLAGKPMESTFVASLDLGDADLQWDTSPVRHKLRRIAWVPVQADRSLPLAERRIGTGLLWSPSAEEESLLRADFEEIVELVQAGFGARITGHRGTALQLRPKGRNAADLRWSTDDEGGRARTAPRAFYLRTGFTHAILQRNFRLG